VLKYCTSYLRVEDYPDPLCPASREERHCCKNVDFGRGCKVHKCRCGKTWRKRTLTERQERAAAHRSWSRERYAEIRAKASRDHAEKYPCPSPDVPPTHVTVHPVFWVPGRYEVFLGVGLRGYVSRLYNGEWVAWSLDSKSFSGPLSKRGTAVSFLLPVLYGSKDDLK
jgi:hypothetical protein